MVNGRDYNEFPLQDNTILKLRAINRTFAGDSKYIYWHDPSEYYENVKIFGNDLVIYYKNYEDQTTIPSSVLPPDDGGANIALINALVLNWIQPVLQSEAYFLKCVIGGMPPTDIRTEFTSAELVNIEAGLLTIINNVPGSLYFSYSIQDNLWTVTNTPPVNGYWFFIQSNTDGSFLRSLNAIKMVVHSSDTKFWVTNDNQKVTTYDTYANRYDTITLLRANVGTTGCSLGRNYDFRVLRQDIITNGTEIGTESIHDLVVLPNDDNNDGIPDDVALSYLIDPANPTYVYFTRASTSDEWDLS